MAGFTICTQPGFVHVIRCVTGIAFTFGRAVDPAQVTLLALNGSMHANQWETGEVVIENDIVVPAFFVVTFIAPFALFALMYIIFSMTGNTVCFDLVFLNFAFMAIRAR